MATLRSTQRNAPGQFSFHKFGVWVLLGVGLAIMILPTLWMVLSSLKTRAEITAIPPQLFPASLNWGNYPEAFARMDFGRTLTNSLIITISVTIISVLTSVWGGYVFGKLRWPGRDLVFLLVLSTMMIPGFLALIPRYVLTSQLGMLNSYWGMIVPFMLSPFGIFLTKQYLLGIPDELLDAAKIDGASAFRIFWEMIVPLSKPIMAVVAIFTIEFVWDDLLWGTLILTKQELWTLPLAVAALRGQYSSYVELQLAGATLAILPILIFFFALQKYIIRGVALTGLKG